MYLLIEAHYHELSGAGFWALKQSRLRKDDIRISL